MAVICGDRVVLRNGAVAIDQLAATFNCESGNNDAAAAIAVAAGPPFLIRHRSRIDHKVGESPSTKVDRAGSISRLKVSHYHSTRMIGNCLLILGREGPLMKVSD